MQKTSVSDYYLEFIDLEKTTKVFLLLSLLSTSLFSFTAFIGKFNTMGYLFSIVAGIITILYFLHFKGYYAFSGFVLSILIPIATVVMILDGNGLNDPGVLAFGIGMVVSSLLFGRRLVLYFVSINSLLVIFGFWIETRGHFLGWVNNNNAVASRFDLFIVLILLTVISYFIWVTIGIIEKNIIAVLESERNTTDAYNLTLEGWAQALELKDKETEGHSRRVTALALKVAIRLGYNDIELMNIERGALLHDIGKMGIDDEILRKQGELTEREWNEIHQHPIFAYTMLKPIDYLKGALDIPYFHHEQWDGKGYPDGIAGEVIPEMARIFALVDNWDALTTDRPYRKAWSDEKVIEYIQSEAGKKFDPRLVPIFLEVVTGK